MLLVRGLFREYQQSLGVDLCFQGFDAELASLPGEYSAPAGELLLAWAGETGSPAALAGCGALRALPAVDYANACELKRVYVRPGFRGVGLGRQITEALIEAARTAGYGSVLLDTLDELAAARSLYRSLGFAEIAPYNDNPIADVHFLKLDL